MDECGSWRRMYITSPPASKLLIRAHVEGATSKVVTVHSQNGLSIGDVVDAVKECIGGGQLVHLAIEGRELWKMTKGLPLQVEEDVA